MNTVPPDIRAQLQTLAIPKDRRPANRSARGGLRFWPIATLLVLAAVAAGAYTNRERLSTTIQNVTQSAPAEGIKLVPVVRQAAPAPPPVLTATGKIVSDHEVQVATKVSGQIVSLQFEQGDRVAEGQLLARIEDVLYRARRDQAAAELEKARANLEYQKINFSRVSRLSDDARAASIEFADAKRWVDDATAQVAAAQAVLEFAQKNLDDCRVVAPITGVILERNVEVGDFVAAEGGIGANANAQFGTIADMHALRVEVDVSELDIARIRKGMRCRVTPDADKTRQYDGFVMWLDPGANYSKATVQVKVRIENPDDVLRVEGSAQVVFLPDATSEDADQVAGLWIPRSAVRAEPDGAAVFVVRDGLLRRSSVVTGGTRGDFIEITEGLKDGDTVVADAKAEVREGQRVR